MRQRLRQERKARDWTQKETAKQLGMTERGYRHLEAGTRTPSKETIDKLEDLFGVPQRELLVPDSNTDSNSESA